MRTKAIGCFLLQILLTTRPAVASSVPFDAVDTHEWIGEDWGSPIVVDHVDFQSRRCLRGTVTAAMNSWAVIRTKRFPLENWESPLTAVRADVHLTGASPLAQLSLEVRGPTFDPRIVWIPFSPLVQDQWQTATWTLPGISDVSEVGHLSIVLENIAGLTPTIYIDNIRLVTALGEERQWDQMDDSRSWFYFGNWFNWSGVSVGQFPGIEPISSNDGSPASPAASLYLQWDFNNGQDPGVTTAEIGTNNAGAGLSADFSQVDRIGAWVRCSSTDVGIRVFLFHCDSSCDADPVMGTGFAAASTFVQSPDTWQQVVWCIPWPAGFDRADVDEIKFVVDGIDQVQTGSARFDNVTLYTDESPVSAQGQVTTVTNYDAQCKQITHLGGNYGELNDSPGVDRVDLERDSTAGRNGSQAALRVDFFNLSDGIAGFWNSLLGRSDFDEFVLDLSRWEYLRFYVRGSGTSNELFNVKLEVKEARPDDNPFLYTAYCYFTIDDSTTAWQPVLVDLDLSNIEAWSYNRFAPDPAQAKELVFVIENFFNPEAGTFYVDDVELIDTDLPIDPILPSSTDAEALTYFLETNFNFFLHAAHPETGLVLDRLSFSDLATVAGTGFGLTAWCLGPEVGLITRDEAFDLASRALNTFTNHPMGYVGDSQNPPLQEGQIGVNGFFYHFLDSRTGTRKVQKDEMGNFVSGSELSSIDTALCLFGVITCRQAMTQANGYSAAQESVITNLADTILSRVDWPFFLKTDAEPNRIYLAWKPEQTPDYAVQHPSGVGYISSEILGGGEQRIYTWDYTTDEILLIAIAGLAAPDPVKRLPVSIMDSWLREQGTFAGHTLVQSFPGSAFTYQFANLWLPLKQLGCDRGGTDWWQNAQTALQANLAFCTHPAVTGTFDSFDVTSFGLTACEDPTTRYKAFGAPPAGECDGLNDMDAIICFLEDLAGSPNRVNGTLAPYGAAASIGFLPVESIAALRHYYFDLGLWNNLFGFPDSFNLNINQLLISEDQVPDVEIDPSIRVCLEGFQQEWWNPDQFSIDQGPLVLALGHHLHGPLVQDWVVSNPDVDRALEDAFRLLGDFDEDCDRDLDDLNTFVAVLLELDMDPAHTAIADMDDNGVADGGDIQRFADRVISGN